MSPSPVIRLRHLINLYPQAANMILPTNLRVLFWRRHTNIHYRKPHKKNFCRVNYESYREIGLPLHPAPRSPQLPSSPLSNLGLNSFTQVWLSPSHNLALAFLIPRSLTPRLGSDCGRAAGLTVAGGGRQPYLSSSCITTATFKPRQAKQMLEESE